jgi:hypothetical protein
MYNQFSLVIVLSTMFHLTPSSSIIKHLCYLGLIIIIKKEIIINIKTLYIEKYWEGPICPSIIEGACTQRPLISSFTGSDSFVTSYVYLVLGQGQCKDPSP